jgi:thioredoxin 1
MRIIFANTFQNKKNRIQMATTFTDANFATDAIGSDQLTVVDFWAPWCGPCLALGPTIDALATEYAGKVNIGKINVDENPIISNEFGITSIPCIIFLKNGQMVDKQLGAVPKAVLEKKIVTHLN